MNVDVDERHRHADEARPRRRRRRPSAASAAWSGRGKDAVTFGSLRNGAERSPVSLLCRGAWLSDRARTGAVVVDDAACRSRPSASNRRVGDHVAPALLFVPPGDGPFPLVLLGHGAHLSKDDPIMQMLAQAIARGMPAGVALMDCPGHGERRPAGIDRRGVRARRARRMRDPGGDAALVADWLAVARPRACRRRPARPGRSATPGFSMGALLRAVDRRRPARRARRRCSRWAA